jgi:RimJ/RimL family protein N-acetyltransferase
VGWWLRSDLWGQGLATEAARAAVAYCFEVVGFERLISAILPANERSIRVAEKVGFTLEGEFHHAGLVHRRYALENPNPPTVHDPRFRRDCAGAPVGSVVMRDGPGCERR